MEDLLANRMKFIHAFFSNIWIPIDVTEKILKYITKEPSM